jgi:hypothetical protein
MSPEIPLYARIPASVQEALGHADDGDFAIAMGNLLFAREEAVGYAALTPAEQVIACLTGLEREVNNGGFGQFFRNAAGDHALETPAALRTLGAVQWAALVDQANAVFPGGRPSAQQDARERELDVLPESAEVTWRQLDQLFQACPDPVVSLERTYVTAHQSAFPIPPRAGGSLMP